MDTVRYREIYEFVHAHVKDYGQYHGTGAVPIVLECLPQYGTFVDIGCGRHQMCRDVLGKRPDARAYGIDIVKCRPIPEGVVFIEGPAWDLSAVPDPIDVITSFDTLEHLYPEDVDRTLSEWARRLAGTLIVSICDRPSNILGPEGVNLHPTVRSRNWWKAELVSYFGEIQEREHGYLSAKI